MKKFFYIIAAITFIFSLFFVIAGKIHPIGDHFLIANNQEHFPGDLYEFAQYDKVREKMYGYPRPEYNFKDCDIVTMGDSFFNNSWDAPPIPQQLNERLDQEVCFLNIHDDFRPLQKLRDLDVIDPGKRKLLILETVERKIPDRFNQGLVSRDPTEQTTIEQISTSDWVAKILSLFNNDDLEYFFRNNIILEPLRHKLMNYKFDLLDETAPQIGAYTRNKDILYYGESVRPDKTAEQIPQQLTALKTLEDELDKINFDLVLVVFPDKISVYDRDLVGHTPNGYLEKFSQATQQSGLNYINILKLFKESLEPNDEMLYYRGDTHINKKGKEIAVNEITNYLQNNYLNQNEN